MKVISSNWPSWPRLKHALAYAFGRLSEEGARRIMYECAINAGYYPIVNLCVEDLREYAKEQNADLAALEPFWDVACDYVARKWDADESSTDMLQWALDKATEYAKEQGH